MNTEARDSEHSVRYCLLWNRVYSQLRSAGYGTSPHDAEDLAQDVFLHLLKNGALERWGHEAEDENHLQAMVLKASKFVLLNAIRRSKTASRDTGGAPLPIAGRVGDRDLELASPSYDPAQEALWHETAAAAVESEHQLQREYEARGKASVFDAVKGSLLGRTEMGESSKLASRYGMAEGQFRVAVHRARRRFQKNCSSRYRAPPPSRAPSNPLKPTIPKIMLPRLALALGFLFAPLSILHAEGWVVENASGKKWFESMGADHLQVNVDELPCAAFGGDQLYYAERDFSGAWHVSTVDQRRGVGSHASLELLENRYPRIAYKDYAHNALRYAAWRLSDGVWGWETEQVTTTGFIDGDVSLALGSNNAEVAHIAYETTAGLHYVREAAGGGWTTPVALDPVGSPSKRYSLIVDGFNRPHILSIADTNVLVYHYFDGFNWHSATLSTRAEVEAAPSMCRVDDILYAAFFQHSFSGTPALIRYLSFPAGNPADIQINEIVAPVPDSAGGSLSLALPPSGRAQIAHTIPGDDRVFHSEKVGVNDWDTFPIADGTSGQPSAVSLDLNSFGRAFVNYLVDDGEMLIASREQFNATTWGLPVVYAVGSDASKHMDMTRLNAGTPIIGYHDPLAKEMVILVRDPAIGWVANNRDSANDPGAWVSVAASRDEKYVLHTAYFVDDGDDLRFRSSIGSIIIAGPITPDSTGDVGRYASLAVNPITGQPAIAYQDTTNGHLKYVTESTLPGGTKIWIPQTLDASSSTGQYAALAFDSAGHPFVAYGRTTGGDVRVISHDGSGWGNPEVVFTGATPTGIDITIDSAGVPHVSFVDEDSDRVWHAWKDGADWDWQMVDPTRHAHGRTSILINPGGQPSVLYYLNDFGEVRISTRNADGTTWAHDTITTLDGFKGEATRTGTLIRDAAGNPMACFYDSIERDVMVAWKPDLKVHSIKRSPTDQVEISWRPGSLGGVWIDSSTNLENGSWTPIAGPLSGYIHTFDESADDAFYRLRIDAPYGGN